MHRPMIVVMLGYVGVICHCGWEVETEHPSEALQAGWDHARQSAIAALN